MTAGWAAVAAAEDHSEFFEDPFTSGPEVTEACLMCHDGESEEVMATTHWTWSSPQSWEGRGGVVDRGKINALNSFCIAVGSNWPRCTSCHAGYGWEDDTFDFTDVNLVDCLVCHERTGTYRKSPTGAGHPAEDVDLLAAAQSVGSPTLANCGACHFFGGGGDHVKHGDLDSSLLTASIDYDVHMAEDGANLMCQDCHRTEDHFIAGNALVVSPGHGMPIECTDCHDAQPHESEHLNEHQRVACQTCHIPTFAKDRPTMVSWDWSTAGQDLPASEDEHGLATYSKKKGSFDWERGVRPAYLWYSGRAEAYAIGDPIDATKPVRLNGPVGGKEDLEGRIYPFKVHRGRQIYDTGRNVMIVPKLYGEGGYWQTYDWDQAARLGMESVDQEYSGEYGFVDTVMYWRINHMVVPADQALACTDCHGRRSDRMDWVALGYGDDPIRLRRAAQQEEDEAEGR
jgi:octaheme c-type cytochrome (tetrathionate reductase family)